MQQGTCTSCKHDDCGNNRALQAMVIHSGGEEITYEKDGRTAVHVEHRYLVVCPAGRRPLGHTRCRLQAGGGDALGLIRNHVPRVVRSGAGGGGGRHPLLDVLRPA